MPRGSNLTPELRRAGGLARQQQIRRQRELSGGELPKPVKSTAPPPTPPAPEPQPEIGPGGVRLDFDRRDFAHGSGEMKRGDGNGYREYQYTDYAIVLKNGDVIEGQIRTYTDNKDDVWRAIMAKNGTHDGTRLRRDMIDYIEYMYEDEYWVIEPYSDEAT
jgi:hypothetical protein